MRGRARSGLRGGEEDGAAGGGREAARGGQGSGGEVPSLSLSFSLSVGAHHGRAAPLQRGGDAERQRAARPAAAGHHA